MLFSGFVIFIMSYALYYSTDLICILAATFNAVRQRNASLSPGPRGQDSHMDNPECQQQYGLSGFQNAALVHMGKT